MRLQTAARRHERQGPLPRSARHDATAVAVICPVAKLFVRCKSGFSHHPSETASEADVRVALAAMTEFIVELSRSIQTRAVPVKQVVDEGL